MPKKRKKLMWWHKDYKRRKKKKKVYKKDEAPYNLIQENEIFIFLRFLPMAALFVCKNETLWKENESTLQLVGYNFSVLSRAYYQYGIEPYFIK